MMVEADVAMEGAERVKEEGWVVVEGMAAAVGVEAAVVNMQSSCTRSLGRSRKSHGCSSRGRRCQSSHRSSCKTSKRSSLWSMRIGSFLILKPSLVEAEGAEALVALVED